LGEFCDSPAHLRRSDLNYLPTSVGRISNSVYKSLFGGTASTLRTALNDGQRVCMWPRPIRAKSVAQTADEPARRLHEVPSLFAPVTPEPPCALLQTLPPRWASTQAPSALPSRTGARSG